jgi:ribosomal protein L11 methyltransferase
MSWLEMTIRAHRREWRYLEGALGQVGALSVTLLDAADEPILEPGAGEMPLWKELLVTALFDGTVDQRGLKAVLQDLVYTLDDARFSFRSVEDKDWTRAWMDQYRPMRFGSRLWVCPSGMELPAEAHADGAPAPVVVTLDPGLAFGSGTHPTTALCLEWLDALAARGVLGGAVVLDYGCGSGILAIAALKLGAARAIGVDNDPQALTASRDNAQRNGIADDAFDVIDPEAFAARPEAREGFDVVCANILAGALVALESVLAQATKPGGRIALSGILAEQAPEVLAAYGADFEGLALERREDWVRIGSAE